MVFLKKDLEIDFSKNNANCSYLLYSTEKKQFSLSILKVLVSKDCTIKYLRRVTNLTFTIQSGRRLTSNITLQK